MPQWNRPVPLASCALASNPPQRLASSETSVPRLSSKWITYACAWACPTSFAPLWIKPVDNYSLVSPTFSLEWNAKSWVCSAHVLPAADWLAFFVNWLIHLNTDFAHCAFKFIDWHLIDLSTQCPWIRTWCIESLQHRRAGCSSPYESTVLWPSCICDIQIQLCP